MMFRAKRSQTLQHPKYIMLFVIVSYRVNASFGLHNLSPNNFQNKTPHIKTLQCCDCKQEVAAAKKKGRVDLTAQV